MNYFILDQNSALNCFYYGVDGSIYQRVNKNGKWSRAVCVISEVRPHYSVLIDNEIIILCQDTNGDIQLCYKTDNGWENKVILAFKGINAPDIRMVRFENSLIYNLPHEKEQNLVIQHQQNGKWQKSNFIDNFTPFNKSIFRMAGLKNGKSLLIYRKNTPEQRLGFRVIDKNGNVGDFKTVYSTGYVITDFSVLEADDFLHFVVAVRGRFSCRLIYIRATELVAEHTNNTLWEGNGIDAVALSFVNGKLIVNHSTGRRLYTFINSGDGFKGVDFTHTDGGMKKAFVANSALSRNDVIVPHDKPYDIDIGLIV